MKQFISHLCCLLLISVVTGCSPKYDWREFRSQELPLIAVFPTKPATHTRDISLNQESLKLHMIAADVNQISFAIAYTKLDESNSDLMGLKQRQQRVLDSMQEGMLKNIQAQVLAVPPVGAPKNTITAFGQGKNGHKIQLVGRFTQHGPWLIQIVMIGDAKQFTPEIMDMFFASIKLS
ncbi:hypothetical protein [Undibacterium fentianense]|uniref:Lipoprotein n=1 Tax=Undibacterium fentianense TaxID=2828728 RepID=A0A941IH41_9BURK|nr:hypothetical protein [Undibacterium fentianense]MBR7800610.1 hypothetical protein [Undibacterium fentianense]